MPVVLVYQETQFGRSLALKRELAIKALSRAEKESIILRRYGVRKTGTC